MTDKSSMTGTYATIVHSESFNVSAGWYPPESSFRNRLSDPGPSLFTFSFTCLYPLLAVLPVSATPFTYRRSTMKNSYKVKRFPATLAPADSVLRFLSCFFRIALPFPVFPPFSYLPHQWVE